MRPLDLVAAMPDRGSMRPDCTGRWFSPRRRRAAGERRDFRYHCKEAILRARTVLSGASLIIGLIALLPGGGVLSRCTAVTQEEPSVAEVVGPSIVRDDLRRDGEFVVTSELAYLAAVRSSGRMLISPFYLEDWPEQVEKLRGTTPDRVVTYLCQGAQIGAVTTFLPVSDRFVIWPFIADLRQRPDEDGRMWNGFDHPLVNRLVEFRRISEERLIYAAIPVSRITERTFPRGTVTRRTTPAEAQWLIFAVIGSDWDGVLWYDVDDSSLDAFMVTDVENALKALAADLISATPVDWVKPAGEEPTSALCCRDRLFVVLLNPSCFASAGQTGYGSLPQSDEPRQGKVAISLPEGCSLRTSSTLLGGSVKILGSSSPVEVEYRFDGGGEMLVLDLERAPSADATTE